eukprot:SAG31_NODE_1345_length_8699_cov_7.525116_3_plen_40_part_00
MAGGDEVKTYSYSFDDVEDEGDRVVARHVSFEVLCVPSR